MFRILVVDNGAIDREVIRSVLVDRLGDIVEILQAAGREDAQSILRVQRIDLLIADVPLSSATVKHLARLARNLNSKAAVILTSVKAGAEMAQLAARLEAKGYLLKPFRREKLLELVCPLVVENREQKSRVEENRAEQDRQLCLAAIGSSVHECQYKKSLETAKEYIDFLFRSNENMNIIRGRTVEFITGLAALGEGHSSEVQQRLNTALERFRLRFDLQSSAFEVAGVAEEMLNVIFAELESRQLYSGDDLKKVLNYIDRNIKRGVTLDMAAAYVGMSASYFSKFFKKYMGVNFITYVTDRKIEAAKDMLVNTDRPVVNIAYDLSYSETNYFSKTFKKKVGVTPTEYREQHLNGQMMKIGG